MSLNVFTQMFGSQVRILLCHPETAVVLSSVQVPTTNGVFAKIKNFISRIFCCFNLDTAVKIKLKDESVYVWCSELSKQCEKEKSKMPNKTLSEGCKNQCRSIYDRFLSDDVIENGTEFLPPGF